MERMQLNFKQTHFHLTANTDTWHQAMLLRVHGAILQHIRREVEMDSLI